MNYIELEEWFKEVDEQSKRLEDYLLNLLNKKTDENRF